MKPLQSIGMGLVLVLLSARFGPYDALPDPVGWLLVALGVRRLASERRGLLLGLAVAAGAVSVALWVPGVSEELHDADPSLAWAANLPQLTFLVLLAHDLADTAGAAGDLRAARWWALGRTLGVVVAVLPVLVFGGGLDQLEVTAYVAAGLTLLLLVCLLFAHAARPWAAPDSTDPAAPAQTAS